MSDLKLHNCNHAIIQVVSKDKKDRRKKSRFGNEEQLKKKSLFPNAVPRIFFNPSRHIRKLESEYLSEATISYPEQGYLLRGTDNSLFGVKRYLQLPLQQWDAGNVYLLVLSS